MNPATGPTILIADDDPHIREVVRFALQKSGFATLEAIDGADALRRFEGDTPDLIVLDLGMPEVDGAEVCRRVRRVSRVPIIFLTAQDDEIDRIVGLELGGDDYITKPFSPRELVARVKAVLRRSQPPDAQVAAPAAQRAMQQGKLCVDLDRFEATWAQQPVSLTATEMHILTTLMRHPGKVYSRDELMDGAYGHGVVVSDRTIDSHLRRVRRKFSALGGEVIETVHGVGYRLGDCRG